jgi:hypothetical protein
MNYFNLNWSFCRSLCNHYGEVLGFGPKRILGNIDVSHLVEALAKTWTQYTHVVSLFVVCYIHLGTLSCMSL